MALPSSVLRLTAFCSTGGFGTCGFVTWGPQRLSAVPVTFVGSVARSGLLSSITTSRCPASA